MTQVDARKPRKPYRPPRLRRVKVSTDEVVLAACKSFSGLEGHPNAGCFTGCVVPGS